MCRNMMLRLARGFLWVQQGLLSLISFGVDGGWGITNSHRNITRNLPPPLRHVSRYKKTYVFFQQDREQSYKTMNPYVV